jgi:hypothetical protein
MPYSGLLHHVALVRTDVSEERISSIIRVARNGEVGTKLAVGCSPILFTLMMEAIQSFETFFLLDSHGMASQKTAFFMAEIGVESSRYSSGDSVSRIEGTGKTKLLGLNIN